MLEGPELETLERDARTIADGIVSEIESLA